MGTWISTEVLIFILCVPVYVALSGFLHEASHAAAGMLEGASIVRFVPWPAVSLLGRRCGGYVTLAGATSCFPLMAPYILNLAIFAVTFPISLKLIKIKRSRWLHLVVVGLGGPMAGLMDNYIWGLRGHGDVSELLRCMSPLAVHVFFTTSSLLCLWLLIIALRAKDRADSTPDSS